MLVVAIVATVATYLGFRQQLWLRQVQNATDRATVESVRQGALAYAIVILEEDLRRDPNVDSLLEKWAKPLVLPFEGGTVAIAVSDAQARFNLNNVLRGNAPSGPDLDVLRRLLISVKQDPNLVDGLFKWIDNNPQRYGGDSKDIEYLSLPVPYRAGNQALQSVDELRLIRGFTKETVDALRPLLIALPAPTEINVNTASQALLAAMFPAGGDAAARTVMQVREAKGFTNIGEFDNVVLQAGATLPKELSRAVKSSYFLVDVDVRVGSIWSRTEAVIHRKGNKQSLVLWQRPRPLQIVSDAEQAS